MAQAKSKKPKTPTAPRLCESDSALLETGCPSYARWVGPDRKLYCSMHFVHRFGYRERLIRLEDYEPPRRPKEE